MLPSRLPVDPSVSSEAVPRAPPSFSVRPFSSPTEAPGQFQAAPATSNDFGPETTGLPGRGRKRVRTRIEAGETGRRVRTKFRGTGLREENLGGEEDVGQEEEEEEDDDFDVEGPTGARGRVRSRFTGTGNRAVHRVKVTGPRGGGQRIVLTGKRRRQKVSRVRGEQDDGDDVGVASFEIDGLSEEVPEEEDRRSDNFSGRRKFNRIPISTGRRRLKPTGGGGGPRRRLRPFPAVTDFPDPEDLETDLPELDDEDVSHLRSQFEFSPTTVRPQINIHHPSTVGGSTWLIFLLMQLKVGTVME